jgi:hypothetical protein
VAHFDKSSGFDKVTGWALSHNVGKSGCSFGLDMRSRSAFAKGCCPGLSFLVVEPPIQAEAAAA